MFLCLDFNCISVEMNYRFVTKVESKHNPCVIESLSDELFVCGTYRLVTEQDVREDNEDIDDSQVLKRVNNRFGSLVVIRVNVKTGSHENRLQVIADYECTDGGLFDIRVTEETKETEESDTEDNNNSFRVIGCHSNGVLVVYGIAVRSDGEV